VALPPGLGDPHQARTMTAFLQHRMLQKEIDTPHVTCLDAFVSQCSWHRDLDDRGTLGVQKRHWTLCSEWHVTYTHITSDSPCRSSDDHHQKRWRPRDIVPYSHLPQVHIRGMEAPKSGLVWMKVAWIHSPHSPSHQSGLAVSRKDVPSSTLDPDTDLEVRRLLSGTQVDPGPQSSWETPRPPDLKRLPWI
jgi:hypothetical protein